MVLRLITHFDVRADVLPSLRAQAAAAAEGGGAGVLETAYESLRVLNIERNGNIIYTYKDIKGNAVFGLYDCQTKQNEHLYTFERDMQAVSCSVNRERTLLAASFVQYTKGVRSELQPGSKCLTLLVEIHPVNHEKVLKAVDSCIWVQFLYPHVEGRLLQNHLLLISEEKYIEQFHIQITREDGNRVVREVALWLRLLTDKWSDVTPEGHGGYFNVLSQNLTLILSSYGFGWKDSQTCSPKPEFIRVETVWDMEDTEGALRSLASLPTA